MDVQSGTGYSVGWFTLALINGGLAQSKQRSGGIWFAVSLLTGPIATLFIVMWPPGTARPVRQRPHPTATDDPAERT